MSHPDPCYDPDNSYGDDDMEMESHLFPWIDDNYDEYNDFHGEYEEN